MGYDRGDCFPFDFEPNGILFGSKSEGKLSPRSYPIQFERKLIHSFLRVAIEICVSELERISKGLHFTRRISRLELLLEEILELKSRLQLLPLGTIVGG